MDGKMKEDKNNEKKLIALFIMLFISSCQHAEEIMPTATQTSVYIKLETIPNPTSTLTPKPIASIEELDYKLKVGDIVCDLVQAEESYPEVYVADCPELIYFQINNEVSIELVTKDDGLYNLDELSGLETIAQELFPGYLTGNYVDKEQDNLVGCYIPYKETAGNKIVCGFYFEYAGADISVLVEGTTMRIVLKSTIIEKSKPSANKGEEKPPNTGE